MEKFINELCNAVNIRLGMGYNVTYKPITRNNRNIEDGIMISAKGCAASPIIAIGDTCDMYKNGEATIDEIAEMITGKYRDSVTGYEHEIGSTMSMLDRKYIEDNVFIKLVNREENKERLADAVHDEFLDLAVVYYVLVASNGDTVSSFLLTHKIAENFGIDISNGLYEHALGNTERLFPVLCRSLHDIVREYIGTAPDEELQNIVKKSMFVLTNADRINGAAVMLYNGVLKDLAAEHGTEGFVILPSSIHEIIFIPENRVGMDSDFSNLVKEVNSTVVEPCEVLSDNVYYYDSHTDRIYMLNDYIATKENRRNGNAYNKEETGETNMEDGIHDNGKGE